MRIPTLAVGIVAHFFSLASPSNAQTFFDSHVHLNRLATQLEIMAERPVERAVIFWGRDSDNDQIVAWANQYPDKFVPFVSVSPERPEPYRNWWSSDEQPNADLLQYLETQLRRGVYKGIGELSIVHFPSELGGFPEAEFPPTHPLMFKIMDLAGLYHVPVMLHCEITYIKELEALIAAFPGVKVIWAHGGYAPLFLTKRMIERYSNLTIELSMRMVLDHPRSPDYWILKDLQNVWPQWLQLIEAKPTRFIVGSDASHHRKAADLRKVDSVIMLLGQLSEGTRRCVGTANLEVLLGFRKAPMCL